MSTLTDSQINWGTLAVLVGGVLLGALIHWLIRASERYDMKQAMREATAILGPPPGGWAAHQARWAATRARPIPPPPAPPSA